MAKKNNNTFVFFLSVLWIQKICFADALLISEVEKLRNSLSRKDTTRSVLTLRLADLVFDEAVQLNKKMDPTAADVSQLQAYRRKAIRLYEEALSKEENVSLPPEDQKIKIKFQLARLYSELNEESKANSLWRELVAQETLKDIRREASLRLAEWNEKKTGAAHNTDAEKFYRLSLDLCEGGDVCSYGHYRLGWLLKNQGKLSEGIEQLRLALWDSKGQVREEVLRDLLVFFSSAKTNGESELNETEAIALKLTRPQLLTDLAESFFSAGNKVAGVKVLEYVQTKTPKPFFAVRLMEEFYGFRNWDRFRELVEDVKGIPPTSITLSDREGVETEKILRRLMVQLDGERLSQPVFAKDFQAITLSYLRLFPGKDRMKVIEGWLASEKEPAAKLAQLEVWINEKNLNGPVENEIRLREFRADVAIKAKEHAIVASEMAALTTLVSLQNPKQREYQFLQATALSEAKRNDESLEILRHLAKPEMGLDAWSLKAQQLALHLLTEKKNYGELITQAELWTSNSKVRSETKWAKDVQKMVELSEGARFEQAVSLGQTQAALDLFKTYCLEKRFLPKSCENARVLSIQLKDQNSLIAILKAQGKKEELASEYEASGYFAQAAELLEQDLKSAKLDIGSYLKTALLYELDNKNNERDRVLGQLIQKLPNQKSLGELEEAVFQTLSDASLLANPTLLRASFSPLNKARVAERLEAAKKGNAETKKLITQAPQSSGPAWVSYAMGTLETAEERQSKIGIYGRNSKKNFERRVQGLKQLAEESEKLIKKADLQTKKEMAQLVSDAYATFAKTIIESPLPEGLSEEDKKQVAQSLAELSAPFSEKAQGFQKLADSITQTSQESHPAVASAVSAPISPVLDVKQALAQLHSNPTDRQALTTIREHYRIPGQYRLSSYFEGRLQQLKEEKIQ